MKTTKHADRAMQFMPFAALRGYYDYIAAQERITQPRRELGEEQAELISNTLNNLTAGMHVKVRYYDIDSYTTISGIVSEIIPPYRKLKVDKTSIPFDDIFSITITGRTYNQVNRRI